MPSRIRVVRAAVVVPVVIAVVVVGVVVAGLAGVGGRRSPTTIPAGCPAFSAAGSPHAPLLSAARTRFVPFPPTAALLCFYADLSSGTGPVNEALAKEVRLSDAAAAGRLADDLDAAARSSAHLNFGVTNCGAEIIARLDVYFQGAGRAILVRISGLPGCSWATNGPKQSSIGNSEIVLELQQLLGITDWMTPMARADAQGGAVAAGNPPVICVSASDTVS